jgi:hypothetical protein
MQTSFANIIKQPFTLMKHLCEMPDDIQYSILSFVNNVNYKDYQKTYWAKQLPNNFIKNVRSALILKHPKLYFENPENTTYNLCNVALTKFRGFKFSVKNTLNNKNNNDNDRITQNNNSSCVNNDYNDDDNNNIKTQFIKKEKQKHSNKIIKQNLLKKKLQRQRNKFHKQYSKNLKSESMHKFKTNNIDNYFYDANYNWFTVLFCQLCGYEYYYEFKSNNFDNCGCEGYWYNYHSDYWNSDDYDDFQ